MNIGLRAGAIPLVGMPSILAGRRIGVGSDDGLLTDRDTTRLDAEGIDLSSTKSGDKALVVLDGADPSSTMRAALQHIDPGDGTVHLLLVFPTAEYEARRHDRIAAGLTTPYTIGQLEEQARLVALRTGHEWLGPSGDEFEAIGAVGRLADCIRRVVENKGCTLIYIAPTKRSRWQRLLGGDEVAAIRRVLPASVRIVPLDIAPEPESMVAAGGISTSPRDPEGEDGTAVETEIPLRERSS